MWIDTLSRIYASKTIFTLPSPVTLTFDLLTLELLCQLKPVYSDATQLNSTRRRVELSCVAIDTITAATQLSVADDRQCNWPSWTACSQSARSRSVVFLFPVLRCDVWYTNQRRSFHDKCFLAPLLFLHGRWRLWSICHINRHVFSIILLTFLQILHSKITSPGKLVKTRHI